MKRFSMLLPVLDKNPTTEKQVISILENYFSMIAEDEVVMVLTKWSADFRELMMAWATHNRVGIVVKDTTVDAIKNSDVVLIYYDGSHMANYFARQAHNLTTPAKLAIDMFPDEEEFELVA